MAQVVGQREGAALGADSALDGAPADSLRRPAVALLPLLLIALAKLLLPLLVDGAYGFHRDELAMVDDARHLAWGYVAYPALAPALGWVALALFGPSPTGLRLVGALSQVVAAFVAGLIAREMGGRRLAQVVAAVAVALSPVAMFWSVFYSYADLDYLWWVLAAWIVLRLLNTGDGRWWLALGVVAGLGLETKWTILVWLAALVVGLLLTPARRQLATVWPWAGGALALALVAPNLAWQAGHGFVSLAFLAAIHARDVAQGRADGFLLEQLWQVTNPFTVPLWAAGLWALLRAPWARPYRALGWAWLVALVLLLATRGRGYYVAAAYAPLLAAGAVAVERWAAGLPVRRAGLARAGVAAGLVLGAAFAAAPMPFFPPDSAPGRFATGVNGELREEIGWPELVATTAAVYGALPADERARAGVLAGNYGEAGAVELYGPAHGLPTPISGVNSFWERGYGDPPPETLVVLGFTAPQLAPLFRNCAPAARVTNRYGLANEESRHPDVFVCRDPVRPWAELWPGLRRFA